MRETFFYTLHAILPILLTILLGYCVRRVGTWSDEFYRQLNSLCFRLFLPIQLFCNVYAIEDLSSMNWKMIGYLFGSVFFCLLVGLVAARLLVRTGGSRVSLYRYPSGPTRRFWGCLWPMPWAARPPWDLPPWPPPSVFRCSTCWR